MIAARIDHRNLATGNQRGIAAHVEVDNGHLVTVQTAVGGRGGTGFAVPSIRLLFLWTAGTTYMIPHIYCVSSIASSDIMGIVITHGIRQ